MARTGPPNAGFKDEAGYNLETLHQDDSDHPSYTAHDDNKDTSPLETAIMTSKDLVFVKLHASWSVMIRVAEVLQFKKPLKQVFFHLGFILHCQKVFDTRRPFKVD